LFQKKNKSINICFGLLIITAIGIGCAGNSTSDVNVDSLVETQSSKAESTVVISTPTTQISKTSEIEISKIDPTSEPLPSIAAKPTVIATKIAEKPKPTMTPTPEPTVQKYISRLVSKINHVFSDGKIADSDWFQGASQEALFNPNFVAADKAGSYFGANDLVIGIDHNGVQKAYPAKYMEVYEVINDRFGNEAILVTY
tara:strand:- start:19538 stop:20134 length:597 start_codon:yes stop_codon:yes gene_type:complete